MKKEQIKVGGKYLAKVSGKITTVRVDSIRERDGYKKMETVYNVTNLTTGRKTMFRSAMKFRSEVKNPGKEGSVTQSMNVGEQVVDRYNGLKNGTIKPETLTEECVAAGTDWAPKEGEKRLPPLASTAELPATKTNPSTTPTSATSAITAPATNPIGGLAARLNQSTNTPPHLIVEARAGTGKTTTLIEGLKRIKGNPTPGFVPSPQQAAVFEQMELSRDARTICFMAFNKSIAGELKSRVPAGCEAMTMHGMGYRAVNRAFRLNAAKAVNSDRVQVIIAELLEKDIWELRRANPTLLQATMKLVSLVKMNLSGTTPEELDQLAAHYEIETNGSRSEIYDLVPRVVERCLDVQRDGFIDYDDMVWLPVALNLPLTKYDLLLVDEAQDLNRCQQALAKMTGRRLILCGDPRQAIYGFAGADADSMPRMSRELDCECNPPCSSRIDYSCGRRCVTLPLTVTRRCSKAVVKEAQEYVPDFEAFETNAEGRILDMIYPSGKSGVERQPVKNEDGTIKTPVYLTEVQDGDMVLCRVNAPLVSQCFRFLKMGRRANIQGRDIGNGLISLITKLGKNKTVKELVVGIDDWSEKETSKENAKKFPSEARLIAIVDKTSCLHCFTEGANTVDDVIRKIESVFTDQKGLPGILLSSIHKAKGLEATRVFLLEPEGATVPHPMSRSKWQLDQEYNLRYVAITRAIQELVYVS